MSLASTDQLHDQVALGETAASTTFGASSTLSSPSKMSPSLRSRLDATEIEGAQRVSKDFFLYGNDQKWKPPYLQQSAGARQEGGQLAKMVCTKRTPTGGFFTTGGLGGQ
eukprot:CAMPEP_0113874552 /NCGR_PEP_ID=MMETSP0780_2-20120614/4400_1 /TAXON_ID=652834 /ORGANISM="Palpitomonas bilix" /LENGTH=109 /DNA_ID=CAMNT_0000860343 /DNA_START=111 /DNA_END=440 /DNA_ORIENTATION=+ /assembly_acc=CAM_ASM_000599